jgi:hypothetical protein
MRASVVVVGVALAVGGCFGAQSQEPEPAAEEPAFEAKVGKAKAGKARGAGEDGPSAAERMNQFPRMAFNNTPIVVRTEEGERHAVWIEERGTVYRRWSKSGEESDAVLATTTGTAATVATDGKDALVALWNDKSGRLTMKVSADRGRTWGDPIEVPTAGGRPGMPSVRAWTGKKGPEALVVWAEGEKSPKSTMWSASWADGKWTEPRRVDSGDSRAEFPTVTGLGEKSAVVWRDDRSGKYHVYAALQDEPGGKWKGEEDTGFSGRDPSACLDPLGNLHVAWHDLLKVYYAKRDRQGWSAEEVVGQGLFARVDCNARGDVLVSWEAFTEKAPMTDDSVKTFGLAVSRDGGETFASFEPAEGKKNVNFASASLGTDGTVDAIWIDNADKAVRVWSKAP